ncbi:MAG: SUMF1/EgtB/PvdO family nonheme iron enzyme [Gammaproteobacteria bacterium]|nr:SUMF1/EgtB/PvdO family nonheme iron enzyme [Gammaproteobacteria bacterium]MDD9864357.1 SUMF1/EgtB/PvdO family nonheme iron enzyme [Gammaproteobacteria bacterium]
MSDEPREKFRYDEIEPHPYRYRQRASLASALSWSSLRPGHPSPGAGGWPRRAAKLAAALAVLAGLLLLAQNAPRPVAFRLAPETAEVRIRDSLHLSIGEDSRLMFPGAHEATLSAPGYEDRSVRFEVAGKFAPWFDAQVFAWRLVRRPGHLDIALIPEVSAEALLDGAAAGPLPGFIRDIPAGAYQLEIRAPGYLPHRRQLEVEGKDITQQLLVRLEEDRKPAAPEQAKEKRPAPKPARAELRLASDPPGAAVSVDGRYRGAAPLRLSLEAGKAHRLLLLKPGHRAVTKTIRPGAGQEALTVSLPALAGLVAFDLQPKDTEIWVAGRRMRPDAQGRLSLPARQHEIVLKAPGYADQTHHVTASAELAKIVRARLLSRARQQELRRGEQERKNGFEFLPFRPAGDFAYKTTRRTHKVRLDRPFAIARTEVSNEQFKRFKSGHSSGDFKGHSLDGAAQPVVRVSWQEAALYANWLSRQLQVAPFYLEAGGQVTGFDPRSAGYRLPTEAEWVWAGGAQDARAYPWGDSLQKIPSRSGNYADKSARALLPVTLSHYNDGQAVSAPVGNFRPNARGLHDLGGNVAEWLHDVFLTKIAPRLEGAADAQVNPLGQQSGRFHVIRGAGWSDGSDKKLRLSYRQYNSDGDKAVGFRLAYYLPPPAAAAEEAAPGQ